MSTLSPAELDERRSALRRRAEDLIAQLQTEDGFRRWISVRRHFHSYSWRNQFLIAAQALGGEGWADGTRFDPTYVLPAFKWKRTEGGYHPRKGSRGLYVWTPHTFKEKGENGEPDRRKTYFRLRPVFDASQVIGFNGSDAPSPPAGAPVTGDSHAHLIAPFTDWLIASELPIAEIHAFSPQQEPAFLKGAQGYYTRASSTIAYSSALAPNAQLRVLIHEAAHATGISYEDFDRGECECIVECAAFCVAATIGLDTSADAIPYIAGWGAGDALEQVQRAAALIDSTAKLLEAPLLAAAS